MTLQLNPMVVKQATRVNSCPHFISLADGRICFILVATGDNSAPWGQTLALAIENSPTVARDVDFSGGQVQLAKGHL